MQKLLKALRTDFPDIRFVEGKTFFWSPKDRTVTYSLDKTSASRWALLHEVSHGILNHTSYKSDFDLVKLEVAAWAEAKSLGKRYKINIDEEHVQDCLDTYRDWLHRRSTCPACGVVSLQKDYRTYECFNCHAVWEVSHSRFCRPYRRLTASPL